MSILPFSEEQLSKSALKAFAENNDLKAQLSLAQQTIKDKDAEIVKLNKKWDVDKAALKEGWNKVEIYEKEIERLKELIEKLYKESARTQQIMLGNSDEDWLDYINEKWQQFTKQHNL